MYCCLHLFIWSIPGIYLFGTCTFVHGSVLYMRICVTAAVCMYVYMYYQPGKVANPACGQLAE